MKSGAAERERQRQGERELFHLLFAFHMAAMAAPKRLGAPPGSPMRVQWQAPDPSPTVLPGALAGDWTGSEQQYSEGMLAWHWLNPVHHNTNPFMLLENIQFFALLYNL